MRQEEDGRRRAHVLVVDDLPAESKLPGGLLARQGCGMASTASLLERGGQGIQ